MRQITMLKSSGDIPIYVALDSADVWSHPELFQLDEEGLIPLKVAGVPPDAFSDEGQLWGNPLYNWDKMEKTGFAWWKERMKASSALYDVIRTILLSEWFKYYSIPVWCGKCQIRAAGKRAGKEN